jgi:hypothetical protein
MNSKSPEAVARQLCNALEQLTGANLAAVWLYGASVFGHPSVDIDVHILLWEQLSANEWESVWNLHERIAKDASLPLEGLDFWYISMKAAGDRSNPVHLAPWTNGLTDNHWPLHRAHWLAGKVVVIYGLEPSAVVQPPTWDELEPVLRDELYMTTPSAYGVLQLCRVWASLETQDVVRSKLDSADWAVQRLDGKYEGIIRAAVRCYEGTQTPDDLEVIQYEFSDFLEEIRNKTDNKF